MIYLESMEFPGTDREELFINEVKRTCYDTFYPFRVFQPRGPKRLVFDEPITILYGGNGSGKSTALNVVAEKLGLQRDALFNRSSFYPDFLEMCEGEIRRPLPEHSRIITSDDVFDHMLNVRTLNEGIDGKREELFDDYLDAKFSKFQYRTMEDLDQLKKVNLARRTTQSKYVRGKLMDNIREYSNGENAYQYFTEKMMEPGLFLLDEPENSLSPKRQRELAQFIEDSARFFGCQIILATHSPFLLALPGAKIYDLDDFPVVTKKWTELENVQVYRNFFKEHAAAFKH